jgi:hypothetical protein
MQGTLWQRCAVLLMCVCCVYVGKMCACVRDHNHHQALYGGLFEWLVARVNDKLRADARRDDDDLFIAILDIFGCVVCVCGVMCVCVCASVVYVPQILVARGSR